MKKNFEKRLGELKRSHKELIKRKNRKKKSAMGSMSDSNIPF
jgi:hypothetical protein